MRLKDKVAIVTGGGHGLGRAYCLALAREGAKVSVVDIDFPAARQVAREVRALKGQALAIKADVSNARSAEAMAQRTARRFGGIDILVNNAAIFQAIPVSRVPFDKVTVEEWDKTMAVNLRGSWLCARAVFPYMKAKGKGKIINISSGTVFSGAANYVHYVTSKAGVIGMTRTLAREMGEFGINVNCLAPGGTINLSPGDPGYKERYRLTASRVGDRIFKRVETPEDLTGTVIYLASSDSDYLTGQTIVVDGGRIMH